MITKYSILCEPWQVNDSCMAKFAQAGPRSMSDREILQLGLGINTEQAFTLWSKCDSNLRNINNLTDKELTSLPGIGLKRLIQLRALCEFSTRQRASLPTTRPKIRCSQDTYKILVPWLSGLTHEEFWALYLDRSNQLIFQTMISVGGISGTVTDIRLIAKHAIDHLASAVIVGHNHPSGNLSPSDADHKITKKIKEGLQVLDISLLDHVIISGDQYLSFADDNLIS